MGFACEAIVCVDLEWGISKGNKIPWKIRQDQQFFREKIRGTLCVMGRKTFDSLSDSIREYIYQNAVLFVFTRSVRSGDYESFLNFRLQYPEKLVMVCGGQDIYQLFFERDVVQRIHVTKVMGTHACDRFFRFPKRLYRREHSSEIDYWSIPTHCRDTYVRKTVYDNEMVYLRSLSNVLMNGASRTDRTGTGVISTFGERLSFDLRMGFPLLTTKKMYWKGIVEELLMFLRGETNTKTLEEKGVNIWKGNTSKEFQEKVGLGHLPEGNMGKMYGYQWRKFHDQVDQLQDIVDEIKKNPTSRRLYVSAWNPCQLKDMVLPPCHVSFQVYVDPNTQEMDLQMYQRSADMFLGVPFNIASYALLLHILCKVCGNYTPRRLLVSIGDAHIYNNHIEQVKEQLGRMPLEPPIVAVQPVDSIDDVQSTDIKLLRYGSHPTIQATMAV